MWNESVQFIYLFFVPVVVVTKYKSYRNQEGKRKLESEQKKLRCLLFRYLRELTISAYMVE